MPADGAPPVALESRILDGALALVGRWGMTKTSLGDIARQAKCGRATVYRVFPGGKEQLFAALAQRELSRFHARVAAELDEARSLEDALVAAVSESAAFIADHEALQFILAHEPGRVLPYLGFNQVDRLYAEAARLGTPHLARWVRAEQAPWAVEWLVRIVVSYLFAPATGVDLTDREDARRLVRSYLLPAMAPVVRPPTAFGESVPVPATTGS